jgi:hypothetical protein
MLGGLIIYNSQLSGGCGEVLKKRLHECVCVFLYVSHDDTQHSRVRKQFKSVLFAPLSLSLSLSCSHL